MDCRWHTVYISWKLVVVPKFLKSQNFKTTFQKNLTCIFLSLRANLEKTVCVDWPCSSIRFTSTKYLGNALDKKNILKCESVQFQNYVCGHIMRGHYENLVKMPAKSFWNQWDFKYHWGFYSRLVGHVKKNWCLAPFFLLTLKNKTEFHIGTESTF